MPLTDPQWSLLQPLLPPPSRYLRGRPPIDDRVIVDAIFWKICHDCAWYDLPAVFPSHQTVYRRYRQWQRLGLWKRILSTLLDDLAGRGQFDLLQAFEQKVYIIERQPNRWTVSLDPLAPLTWQVVTGWVFAWLVAAQAYQASDHP